MDKWSRSFEGGGGQRRGLLSSEGPKDIRCATQVGRSVPSLFLSAWMHKSPLCIFSPLRPLPVLPGLIRLGLQRRRRANVTLARLALFFMLFFKSTSFARSLARSTRSKEVSSPCLPCTVQDRVAQSEAAATAP